MKLKHHENGKVEFLCDGCGKTLDDADPGEVFFSDYDWFLEHVEEAGPEVVWFLCRQCFIESQGPAKKYSTSLE